MSYDLKKALKLYAVTDSTWLKGKSLADAVEQAILGGVTIVQYREKSLTGAELKAEAKSVLEVCRKYNIPFIVNDDPYLAKVIDADGVHLGQGDMPIGEARELLGPDKIIGITAKTTEQAESAERDGADYLGSGAMFGSSTKTDAKKMSTETLKTITACVKIPVVAIGGINAINVPILTGTGIQGVAVVSGIFANDDVKEGTAHLYSVISESLGL